MAARPHRSATHVEMVGSGLSPISWVAQVSAPSHTAAAVPNSGTGRLGVSPLPEQIVIDPRQAYARVVIGPGTTQALQGVVEVEKNRASGLVSDHALYPEKCRHSYASRDRHDVMDGAPAVQDHVTGRQF